MEKKALESSKKHLYLVYHNSFGILKEKDEIYKKLV
jgi:hypothetical protein